MGTVEHLILVLIHPIEPKSYADLIREPSSGSSLQRIRNAIIVQSQPGQSETRNALDQISKYHCTLHPSSAITSDPSGV